MELCCLVLLLVVLEYRIELVGEVEVMMSAPGLGNPISEVHVIDYASDWRPLKVLGLVIDDDSCLIALIDFVEHGL